MIEFPEPKDIKITKNRYRNSPSNEYLNESDYDLPIKQFYELINNIVRTKLSNKDFSMMTNREAHDEFVRVNPVWFDESNYVTEFTDADLWYLVDTFGFNSLALKFVDYEHKVLLLNHPTTCIRIMVNQDMDLAEFNELDFTLIDILEYKSYGLTYNI